MKKRLSKQDLTAAAVPLILTMGKGLISVLHFKISQISINQVPPFCIRSQLSSEYCKQSKLKYLTVSVIFLIKNMGKQCFKAIRLFLKIVLLAQIYSLHCFKAESTENQFPESFHESKVSEETGFNEQISDKDTGLSVNERPERPARLLPLKMLL